MTQTKADLSHSLFSAFAFSGAFLMFVLEPMVGRLLLPAYGGGFHVWTTCLMFFQGVLLLGYLYAHLVAPRIGRWHLVVAALPLLSLPVDVVANPDPNAPIASILVALVAHIALPIGVLSTTGVVAQTWLSRSRSENGSDPYWLYAASNAGSLLGLLAYPFLVEPVMGVAVQRTLWSALYVGYLVLAFVTSRHAGISSHNAVTAAPAGADTGERVGAGRVAFWFALSMIPSVMLMAVTNAISFDVGSIPLVWVAPLALYLTTFILVFGKKQRYPSLLRRYWPEMAIAGVVAFAAAPLFPSWPRLAVHLVALFAVCMAGHAELHRLRPPAGELTKFYLLMSLGGWAGGVFVSLAAPVLFTRLFEYPLAVAALAVVLVASRQLNATAAPLPELRFGLQGMMRAPVAVTALAFSAAMMMPQSGGTVSRLYHLRNHYGLYQVGEVAEKVTTASGTVEVPVRYIVHNGTVHGGQMMAPGERRKPIGYYHPASGLGELLTSLPRPFKLGVVGLGAGGTTAHIGAGDEIVFYEIDPDDETIAREHFTYLSDCPGRTRVVIGDARMMLAADRHAPDGHFDVFLVDAFSGDAIPTHLLTKEALELYRRKVRPGGLLVFHITNRFYDLRPALRAAEHALGMYGAYKTREVADGLAPLERRTRYYVMSEDHEAIDRLVARGWTPTDHVRASTLWTDDYVNVLAAMWSQLKP